MGKRSLSSTAMLFTSISAILGSGWLFSAYYTSEIAGPAALLSWVIGGISLGIIAFIFAELGAMIPVTGSSVRIPKITHGTLVSFIFSWFIWLSYASLAPTEIQGVIQYITLFFPNLANPATGQLTHTGFITAATLMLCLVILNTMSLRWLIRANNILTIFKMTIPIVIAGSILFVIFNRAAPIQLTHEKFSPYGIKSIFTAISTGGIIFAFNGFKQACEMAGEAKNPAKSIPIAIIGSIVICLIIYIVLQLSFISSLTVANLHQGWSQLSLSNNNSPFSSILIQDHLPKLLSLTYTGAIIGPIAAALMYVASASRSIYGISHNGCLPIKLMQLNTKGNPTYAIILNFFVGLLLFAPLPGWNAMVAFLTSLMAISYAIGPVCLISLRKQLPKQNRPLKLPFGTVWGYVAFSICNFLAYWTGWDNISKLSITILLSIVILFTYRACSARAKKTPLNARQAMWMVPYFIGLSLISYGGNFGGGAGLIPFRWDNLILLVLSIMIMKLATTYKLPSNLVQQEINKLEIPVT